MFAERFRTTRMVLRTCPGWLAVEALADAQGWPLAEDRTTASEIGERREARWDVRPAATVRYVEDHMSPHCWVVVGSPLANRTQSLAQIVFESLDPCSLQECERLVETATSAQNLVASILRLGIAAPYKFDYSVYTLIAAGLTCPDERGGIPVRSAAMWATTYSPYREYRRLLEEIAHRDPAEELRGRAQLVLEAFAANGVS